jgi:hypothetical protein
MVQVTATGITNLVAVLATARRVSWSLISFSCPDFVGCHLHNPWLDTA